MFPWLKRPKDRPFSIAYAFFTIFVILHSFSHRGGEKSAPKCMLFLGSVVDFNFQLLNFFYHNVIVGGWPLSKKKFEQGWSKYNRLTKKKSRESLNEIDPSHNNSDHFDDGPSTNYHNDVVLAINGRIFVFQWCSNLGRILFYFVLTNSEAATIVVFIVITDSSAVVVFVIIDTARNRINALNNAGGQATNTTTPTPTTASKTRKKWTLSNYEWRRI